MLVKIMGDDDAPDSDSRKTFRLISEVVAVSFHRPGPLGASAEVHCAFGGSADDAERFQAGGNVYVMNDNGKTVATFGAHPLDAEARNMIIAERLGKCGDKRSAIAVHGEETLEKAAISAFYVEPVETETPIDYARAEIEAGLIRRPRDPLVTPCDCFDGASCRVEHAPNCAKRASDLAGCTCRAHETSPLG